MQTVTVSEQGQVFLPLDIRKQLGITPGSQLNLILENAGLRVEVKKALNQRDQKIAMAYWYVNNLVKDI
jgi:AbrB family looped-hinge helix DNA binding protein